MAHAFKFNLCGLLMGVGLWLAGCGGEPAAVQTKLAPGQVRLLAMQPISGQAFTLAELDLEMRPIPAGTFEMGSPYGEPGRTSLEGPQTKVTLSRSFWLGRTPVTHAQWQAIMGTDLLAQAKKGFPNTPDARSLLTASDGQVPMHFVSWHDAMEFCARLNARARAEGTLPAGYEFTLPTEAQWEYACRAGTTAATYAGPLQLWGRNHAPVLDEIAWYAGNSSVGFRGQGWPTEGWAEKQYPGGTAGVRRVGLKQANAWGLCDMLGNVYQWCGDFSSAALPGGSVTDPTGPESGSDHMLRGGSWHSAAAYCRASYRSWNTADGRMPFIGFRLALAPKIER